MNPFDHFMKETLRVKCYLRYTDDFIFLHTDREAIVSLLPRIRELLKQELTLDLHPNKIILRKLSQGIDFLGYVVCPRHRILRTKTKRRMFRRIEREGLSKERLDSYLGLLSHVEGYALEQRLRALYLEDERNGISKSNPPP